MILLVSATLYHALLGVQVVVEDYIHQEGFKFLLLIGLKFLFLVLGVAAIFSLLKIAL
jgi:succinate dehydrogenase / fumarate reductase membrane anchor subunit